MFKLGGRVWALLLVALAVAVAAGLSGWVQARRLDSALLASLVLILLLLWLDLRRATREQVLRTRRIQIMTKEAAALLHSQQAAWSEAGLSQVQQMLDAHSRRTLAALEGLRLDLSDDARRNQARVRQQAALLEGQAEGLEALSNVSRETKRAVTELGKSVNGHAKELMRAADAALVQAEARSQLYRLMRPRAAMPLAGGGFAMSSETLLNLVQLIHRHKPRLVVELGSGASTLWAAHALLGIPDARLVSFDHEPDFLAITRSYVQDHDLELPVEVRWAPLVEIPVADRRRRWYSPEHMSDLQGIDLLIVDGPPKSTGDMARLPAVPQLISRLSDGALLLVDDMHRRDERAMVQAWLTDYPGLEVLYDAGLHGRHAVLRYRYRPEGEKGAP